jgi:GYF domain 2
MKTIDIVMIPVSLAIIALWIYSLIGGIRAARRKGISPHWMWFGVNPLTGLFAFAIIKWCVADRKSANDVGSRAFRSSTSSEDGLNSGECVVCQSWWATKGPDFFSNVPCILRITDQRVITHYSYFDSFNSGALTLSGGWVAICAAYRAIKNKPKYTTIPFEAIDILSVKKKIMAYVYKIRIKSGNVGVSTVKFTLKPADAAQLFSAMPSFSREGPLGALKQSRPTQSSTEPAVPEKVPSSMFYYRANGVVVGPLDSYQLRQHAKRGALAPDSMVKKGEDGKWVSASHVKGLFGQMGQD